MPAPQVSIIIPVYNGADFLRDAIDSALAQTYPHCEVLVVNDGSDDGGATEAVARSYGDSIRYFAKPNGGVASALNYGIEQMRGELVAWLSHDDVFLPDKTARQVEALQNLSDAERREGVFAVSDYRLVDASLKPLQDVKLDGKLIAESPLYALFGHMINGCTTLISRDLLIRAGLFRPLPTTQDYDLWFRLLRLTRLRYVPGCVLYSRQHPRQGFRCAKAREEADLFWIHLMEQLTDAEILSVAPSREAFFARVGKMFGGMTHRGAYEHAWRQASPRDRLLWQLAPTTLLKELLYRMGLLSHVQHLARDVRAAFRKAPVIDSTAPAIAAPLPAPGWLALAKRLVSRCVTTARQGGCRATATAARRYLGKALRQWQSVRSAAPATPQHFSFPHERPLCLILDHDSGGGALAFRQHKLRELRAAGWDVLTWQYLGSMRCYLFELVTPENRKVFFCKTFAGAQDAIRSLKPETVFHNDLVGWPDVPLVLAFLHDLQRAGARLEIFLHDYFAVCPAYPLLDRNGRFCGIPIPATPCQTCLPGHPLAAPHTDTDVVHWRQHWAALFAVADAICVADVSVRELLARAYPTAAERIQIVPHRPLQDWQPLPPRLSGSAPPTIAVIGTITRHKGAGIVEDLVRLLDQRELALSLLVIGTLESSVRSSRLKLTGPYKHDALPALLLQHHVDVCLVPSILPETFCYVAQEIEMLGLPLVCLDMGAQGARARRYAKGFVAQTPDAQGCLDAILQAVALEPCGVGFSGGRDPF